MTDTVGVYGPFADSDAERAKLLEANGPRIPLTFASASGSEQVLRDCLIDTGASDIVVGPRLVRQLGLMLTDSRSVGVVGGAVQATVHAARLIQTDLGFNEVLEVVCVPTMLAGQPILLGRRFLSFFNVSYEGPSGTFYFYKPKPTGLIDAH